MNLFKQHKEIIIPKNVFEICHILENNGEETWVVGGCIRDTLLDITPNDWDITTSATPEKVISLFGSSFGNGINYGIPFIHYKGEEYEIAQFRKDLNQDGRHCEVAVALSIDEDLIRRDFTINAIAYRPKTNEIAFPNTALEDLENKVLRCVGNPYTRYNEDALRVLRLYRFASTLNFSIEEESRNAAKLIAKEDKLNILSGERIRKEMTKLLLGLNAKNILMEMKMDEVLEKIFPELKTTFDFQQDNKHHNLTLFEHLVSTVSFVEDKMELRWAALFHDLGKPNVAFRNTKTNMLHYPNHATISTDLAEPILRRLAFSNEERLHILNLIKYHDFMVETKAAIRKMCGRDGVDFAMEIVNMRTADILSQSLFKREEKLQNVSFMKETIEEIVANNQKFTLKDLKINGKDLIEIGVQPGPNMGKILELLLEEVLVNPNLNEHNTLLELSKKYL